MCSAIIDAGGRGRPGGVSAAMLGVGAVVGCDAATGSDAPCARSPGAGAGRVFTRIVLPLISAALVSCWLFVFLLAVQNVALPLMLVRA